MTISQNDILTAAAFLAIGWDERMKQEPGQGEAVKDRAGMGMDGLISEVVQYAEVVESVWHDADDETRDSFCGVWAYELLEPVGLWIAERMIANESVNADNVRAYALELFAEHTGPFNEEPAPEPITLYAFDAERIGDEAPISWFFDDVAQLGEACKIATRLHVTLSSYRTVTQKPDGDFITSADEFNHWARRKP